jgi:hypothetical protein
MTWIVNLFWSIVKKLFQYSTPCDIQEADSSQDAKYRVTLLNISTRCLIRHKALGKLTAYIYKL